MVYACVGDGGQGRVRPEAFKTLLWHTVLTRFVFGKICMRQRVRDGQGRLCRRRRAARRLPVHRRPAAAPGGYGASPDPDTLVQRVSKGRTSASSHVQTLLSRAHPFHRIVSHLSRSITLALADSIEQLVNARTCRASRTCTPNIELQERCVQMRQSAGLLATTAGAP